MKQLKYPESVKTDAEKVAFAQAVRERIRQEVSAKSTALDAARRQLDEAGNAVDRELVALQRPDQGDVDAIDLSDVTEDIPEPEEP